MILIISEILQFIIDILEMFLIIEYDFFDIVKVMPNINALQREKFRILYSLLGDEEEDNPELEELLSNQDLLSSMMEELREFSPGAGVVLIDERDSYLAEKILSIDTNKKVLAVVGAGHLQGLEANLLEP